MGDGVILQLLFGSALRSLLLGAGVLALLKLVRLRDPRAETLAWTLVLVASLLMPLLSRWLPGAVIVPIPRFTEAAPVVFTGGSAAASMIVRHSLSAGTVFWGIYCAVTATGFVRLIVGLALTHRFYRAAQPIDAIWAWGRNVRVSDRIHGPLSFGSAILLPSDYRDWPQAKLLAVLAHEESHVERGDFFIQLLASAHRALFWFNPFAWWLQARLSELAETASDEAAIRRIQDAPRYAEILLEVSRKTQPMTFASRAASVGMAQGPSVARRMDHILAWRPHRALGLPARVAGAVLLLTATVGLAQVHASVGSMSGGASAPSPAWSPPVLAALQNQGGSNAHARPSNLTRRSARRTVGAQPSDTPPATTAPESVAVKPEPGEPEITYNPRALLDDPDIVAMGSFVGLHKTANQPSN